MPDNKGLQAFGGEVINAFEYKSGEKYSGKKVLTAVCGNSGMEVPLIFATTMPDYPQCGPDLVSHECQEQVSSTRVLQLQRST